MKARKLDLARNLTQAQLDEAFGDAHTRIPADLHQPDAWRAASVYADEDLLLDYDASPHEVLGLSPKASLEEIRTAYRRLAKKYHPDLNPGDLIAERRFQKISEAYKRLTAPLPSRVKQPKPRRSSFWAMAIVVFACSLMAPSLALHFLGWPPLTVEPRKTDRVESAPARVTEALPAGPQSAKVEYTAALPASPPASEASPMPAPMPEVPNPEAVALPPEPPALKRRRWPSRPCLRRRPRKWRRPRHPPR